MAKRSVAIKKKKKSQQTREEGETGLYGGALSQRGMSSKELSSKDPNSVVKLNLDLALMQKGH